MRQVYLLKNLKDENLSVYNMITTTDEEVCPHCGKSVHFLFDSPGFTSYNNYVAFLCQCPNCNKVCFVTGYMGAPEINIDFNTMLPKAEFHHQFQKEINKISPDFVVVYEQAMQAKISGLDELVGMGLRKALEHLTFDFISNVLKEKPADGLSDMIKNLSSPDVRYPAQLASWIGNDETHVNRKNPDCSVEEMENYIKCVVYFMCSSYVSRQSKDYIDKKRENSSKEQPK